MKVFKSKPFLISAAVVVIWTIGFAFVLNLSPYQSAEEKSHLADVQQNIQEAATRQKAWATADYATLRCPEDYANDDERTKALNEFLNYLRIQEPQTYGQDFVSARMDFYISHNCTQMLQEYGYNLSGPITPEIRQQLIQTMTGDTSSQSGN